MATAAIAALVALVASGCSSGVTGLTTGSLGGAKAPAAPQPPQPTDRAIHAAAVSARAEKCGYNFDVQRLRSAYLGAEGAQGTQPAELAQLEKLYDITRTKVFSAIRGNADYCTDEKTREIKADLQRQLGGDFNAPKKVADSGGLSDGGGAPAGRETLNPEWINNPKWESRTRRSE